MNGPFLTLLAAIIAALTGLGALGAVWPRRGHEVVGFGATGLAGLAALLTLLSLVLDDPPAVLTLPLGLPGAAFRLGLDPLAAFFATLVFATGAATCAFAAATDSTMTGNRPAAESHSSGSAGTPIPGEADTHAPRATEARAPWATEARAPWATEARPVAAVAARAPTTTAVARPSGTAASRIRDAATGRTTGAAPLPICLAGLGLAVLATDASARATGLAIAGGAIWAMGPPDRTGAVQLGMALLGAAAIVIAGSAPAPALLWLAWLGPGALAGLIPLHTWLTPAHQAPTPAAALLSGAMVPVAIYAILRILFDPAGAAPPAWWGAVLMVLGVGSVVAGGFDAARRPDLDTAVAAGTVRQTGLTAIGLGIALTARAADLPGVVAMALAAVMLLATLQAVGGTLLALAAGAIRHGAGTRQLDRLGGLIHRMPMTTACLLAALFGVAALPPGPGFAAVWLLFQALLALPRAGGLAFQLLLCVLTAALGLGAALASASLLRLIGVACLGRPRTPRAAVADEPPRPARHPMLALAATVVVLGVFVGPFLRLLADAPIQALTGTGLGARATLLGLAPGAESPGYAALPLASLLLLAVGLVLWLRWLRGIPAGAISGPAWEDGFAAPPAWLPFGNPITQTSGAGFVPLPAWRSGPLLRHAMALPVLVPRQQPRTVPPPDLPTQPDQPNHPEPHRQPAPLREPRLLLRPALPSALSAPAVALILAAALLALCAWAGTT